MRLHRSICQLMTIAALLCLPILSYAQTPPTTNPTGASPSGKSTVKVEMVPSLIVMNARGASLQGQTLTLTGVSPNSITFADRPTRAAGHLLTQHLLEEWTVGSFAKDAPNATVSVLSKDGASVRDAVVELRDPHLDGDRLTFDVRVLEGDLAGADGPASVFVDIIGLHSPRCLSPGSPAARRDAPIGTAPRPQERRQHTATRITVLRLRITLLRTMALLTECSPPKSLRHEQLA
jgi:hypothetical protein